MYIYVNIRVSIYRWLHLYTYTYIQLFIYKCIIYTVKSSDSKFEGTKHSCPLLQKSLIDNIESERKKYQGTVEKFAIVRFSATLGSITAGFHRTN